MIIRTAGLFARRALVAVFILASSGLSEAAVIGSGNLNGWGLVIGKGVLNPELNLRFALSNTGGSACWVASPPDCYILLDQVLTPADIGRTFSIDAVVNANFPGVAASLTDGIDNEWSFSQFSNPNGGVGSPVSSMFPNGSGPDFSGYSITSIDLTINNLPFKQVMLPSSLTNWDIFTEVNPDVTISVHGNAVPEPATLPLLVMGGLIFLP